MSHRVLGSRAASLDAESSRTLVAAFDIAVENPSMQTMHVVHVEAIEFVTRLKRRGLAPERVIIALKNALRAGLRFEDGWFPSLDVGNSWPSNHGAATLYERVFRWCVEAYFDETISSVRGRAVRRQRPIAPPAWSATP